MIEWLNESILLTRSELLVVCFVVYITSYIDRKALYIMNRIMRFYKWIKH